MLIISEFYCTQVDTGPRTPFLVGLIYVYNCYTVFIIEVHVMCHIYKGEFH